jgi:hypothetical protein
LSQGQAQFATVRALGLVIGAGGVRTRHTDGVPYQHFVKNHHPICAGTYTYGCANIVGKEVSLNDGSSGNDVNGLQGGSPGEETRIG